MSGFNTDGPGFLAHLAELKFDTTNKRIAILGAGGTARAIMASLCLIPEKPETIFLYNRTIKKARELLSDLGEQMDVSRIKVADTINDLNLKMVDFLINTTSVGLNKNDLPLINEERLHSKMLVYDVIYNPQETSLLKLAKQKGARTANGLGMLFYQGILSLQHWANIEIDRKLKEKIRKTLESEVSV